MVKQHVAEHAAFGGADEEERGRRKSGKICKNSTLGRVTASSAPKPGGSEHDPYGSDRWPTEKPSVLSTFAMQMPPYGYATPQTPDALRDTRRGALSAADQSSLDSLAIFHFVYAALIALGGFITLAAVLFGVGLVSSSTHLRGGGILAGGVFMIVLVCVAAILFLKAFLVFYSGVSLRRARHKLLSQIVACLCCFNFPMGTALGIFTLVTLGKPSVAARYLFTASDGVR